MAFSPSMPMKQNTQYQLVFRLLLNLLFKRACCSGGCWEKRAPTGGLGFSKTFHHLDMSPLRITEQEIKRLFYHFGLMVMVLFP